MYNCILYEFTIINAMRTVNNIAISSKFIIRHIINPPKYGPNQLWRINEYSLYQYLALAPRTFPVDTHDLSEVLWAYLCSVGYAGANTNIWH